MRTTFFSVAAMTFDIWSKAHQGDNIVAKSDLLGTPDVFSEGLLAQNECWVQHTEPVTKGKHMPWKQPSSFAPKEVKAFPCTGKGMEFDLWMLKVVSLLFNFKRSTPWGKGTMTNYLARKVYQDHTSEESGCFSLGKWSSIQYFGLNGCCAWFWTGCSHSLFSRYGSNCLTPVPQHELKTWLETWFAVMMTS